MESVSIERQGPTALLILSHGKVNAIDDTVVTELSQALHDVAADSSVTSVVFTGTGKFCSFGFDVPEMYDRTPQEFTRFVRSFCYLYREMFLFPKPLIAALNGHAVAGGCILALACDYRIMVNQAAKMSLNEVRFGASLFSGVIEMLRYWVGSATAERMLLSGDMFYPDEARQMGLVNELVHSSELMSRAVEKAQHLAAYYGHAYSSLKRLIRQPVVDAWAAREEDSIHEWIAIWYSPETREKLKNVQIRS